MERSNETNEYFNFILSDIEKKRKQVIKKQKLAYPDSCWDCNEGNEGPFHIAIIYY